jgi:DNA-binding IclR family transcriptional regulator
MKAACRVIEVLEFFEDHQQEATVMEIARRYNRPQSSTSELLAALVDIGLLHKDPYRRTYRPTPRVGIVGSSMQHELLRNGKLLRSIDEIAVEIGQGISLVGMVGTHLQIYRWRQVEERDDWLGCGQSVPLHEDAAGQLLLSTVSHSRLGGMLRRLNAEAEQKFDYRAMVVRVEALRRSDYALGESGFLKGFACAALRLPGASQAEAMALSIHYNPDSGLAGETLLARLRGTIAQVSADGGGMGAGTFNREPVRYGVS